MNIKEREYIVAVKRSTNNNRLLFEEGFTTIKNNFFSWSADPFPIEVDGELYIFAEVFLYSKFKGTIGYTKLTSNGFTKWKTVIEESYHLSFPNLFWIDGSLYMCPESHQNNSLTVYKCEKFPDEWVKIKNIAQGDFNDTIFFKDSDTILALTYTLDNKLFMYKLDDEDVQKIDLSNNVSDVIDARPAGKIFRAKGHNNILVTQIGKPAYGSGLVFKDISIEWPQYTEKEFLRITAEDIKIDKSRNYIGVHTFNVSEHYTVIDLIWEDVIPQRFILRIIRKVKKIFGA